MNAPRTVISDRWLNKITVRIVEFDDDTVDIYVYIDGNLFTRKHRQSTLDASMEIGAAVFEEAK